MPSPFRLSAKRAVIVAFLSVAIWWFSQFAAFFFMVVYPRESPLWSARERLACSCALQGSVPAGICLSLTAILIAVNLPRIDFARRNCCEIVVRKTKDGRTDSAFIYPSKPFTPVGETPVRRTVLCLGAAWGIGLAVWLAPVVASNTLSLRGSITRVVIGALAGLYASGMTNGFLFRIARQPMRAPRHSEEPDP